MLRTRIEKTRREFKSSSGADTAIGAEAKWKSDGQGAEADGALERRYVLRFDHDELRG